jgi:hypothetical protein
VNGAYGTHGRGEKSVQGPKERDYSEDRGIDGRMGLKRILGRLAGKGGEFAWLWLRTGGGLS